MVTGVTGDPHVDMIQVDGIRIFDGSIELWGKAKRQPDGKYQCLADVYGALCVIEIGITEVPYPLVWEGDQA